MKQNNKSKNISTGNDKLLSEITSKPDGEAAELDASIIDTVREPLIILDKDLRVVKANRSFFNYFKVSPGETIGALIYNLGNGQWDIPKLRELLETILPEKTSFDDYEVTHIFSKIGKRVMLLNARRIERAFGKEKIILLAIEDITDRKSEEEILAVSNRVTSKYLDILLDRSRVPIIIWNSLFEIVRLNQAFEKLSGYHLDELKNQKLGVLFPKEKIDSTLEFIKISIDTDDLNVIEVDILTRDNQIKTVLWNSENIYDESEAKIVATMAQDITSRKLIEQQLQESEERFRNLYRSAKVGLYRTTPSGKILMANNELVKMLGYASFEQLAERNIEQQGFGPSYPRKEFIEKIDRDGEINNFESSWIRLDGSAFFVRENAHLIRDANGNALYYDGVVEDITERKLAEEESLMLAHSLKSINECVSITDMDDKILFVNKAFLDTYGYDANDLIGKQITIVRSKKNTQEYVQEILPATKQGEWKGELLNQRKDGSVFPIYLSTSIIYDKDSKPLGLIGVASDITVQKQMVDDLLKLSRAVEQSPASIIITDVKGIIEYANPKVTEITGYQFSELEGNNPRIFSTGEKPANDYKILWDTISSGKEWRGEFHNKKKNGELYWESASISPIKNENGEVTHFIGIKEDITEKKNMIDELIQAKEKAEEMNRLKSNFLANMSHELRTPLVGILGYAEIIRQEKASPEIKAMAETIYKSGNRLSETLNLILDLSRLETEKKEIKYQRVELVEKTKEVITLFKEAAYKKGLLLKTSFSSESIVINFDERAYNSIISNLINNAIKFTSKGSITTSVILYDRSVEIRVTDTGIGIAEEDYQAIFDEFRQASEGFSRNFEGSGLGLSITKKLVEKYGGTITVESEVGKGSTFKVILPVTNGLENLKEPAASKIIISAKSPETKLENPIGLLVDDDPVVFLVMKRYLRDYVALETTNSAEIAFKMLKEKKYDLIFMDINLMHGTDGKKAAAMIRKMDGYEFTPIIATTAFAMAGDKEEFLSAGCSHYLSKPFNKIEIIDVVVEALNRKSVS